MFIHDLVKIHLSREGYLPNYPPHLISDEEMCDAFLPYNYDPKNPTSGYEESKEQEINYFMDMYPLVHEDLLDKYKALVAGIAYHLNRLKTSLDAEYKLPDWVYSYMLGQVIGPASDQADKHYLFVMLGTDNLDDDFDAECCEACYKESEEWLKKVPNANKDHRPISLFGELHVIKSLRLKASDMSENEIKDRVQEDLSYGRQVI